MWVCRDCGNVFRDCKVDWESHGLDTPPYEKINLCPNCLSSEISFAHKCECCGEYSSRVYVSYCDDCANAVKKEFKEQIVKLFPNRKDRHFLLCEAVEDEDWGLV